MTLLANYNYLRTYYAQTAAQFVPRASHVRLCSHTAYSWATNILWNQFVLLYQKKAVWGRNTKLYLLTYSMVQSPSWEANWFAASQEIPCISRNPKVHYRIHKRPPPVPILGQPNPVHITTSHLLEIRPNIIHPSTPQSPHWSLSLLFPHQDPH